MSSDDIPRTRSALAVSLWNELKHFIASNTHMLEKWGAIHTATTVINCIIVVRYAFFFTVLNETLS